MLIMTTKSIHSQKHKHTYSLYQKCTPRYILKYKFQPNGAVVKNENIRHVKILILNTNIIIRYYTLKAICLRETWRKKGKCVHVIQTASYRSLKMVLVTQYLIAPFKLTGNVQNVFDGFVSS